jgi:hypothetical protein
MLGSLLDSDQCVEYENIACVYFYVYLMWFASASLNGQDISSFFVISYLLLRP